MATYTNNEYINPHIYNQAFKEIEHEHTTFPICPHCGNEEKDTCEMDFGPFLDGETEFECNNCGKEMKIYMHCEVTYTTDRRILYGAKGFEGIKNRRQGCV